MKGRANMAHVAAKKYAKHLGQQVSDVAADQAGRQAGRQAINGQNVSTKSVAYISAFLFISRNIAAFARAKLCCDN